MSITLKYLYDFQKKLIKLTENTKKKRNWNLHKSPKTTTQHKEKTLRKHKRKLHK